MPELPEVETVRRTLSPFVLGKTLQRIDPIDPFFLRPEPVAFNHLIGQEVTDLTRRGKYLLWHFGSRVVAIHLRMTGRLMWRSLDESWPKHTHLRFIFDDGQVWYNDVRRFGGLFLNEFPKSFADLGPEPFDLVFADFHKALQKTERPIKSTLLDQSLIAGLGNIYVDEALFMAGVDPRRESATLSQEETEKLLVAIQTVIDEAILAGGTTFRSYVDAQGRTGSYVLQLKAYGRTNEPCYTCGTIMTRKKIGGRTTHFCSLCQR